MESARKILQIVRSAMLVSIALYVLVGERIAKNLGAPPTNFYFAITLVAITTVGMTFAVRRLFVLRAEVTLAAQPEDATALNRWRAGYIITYALCEAMALFGLVLRVLGFTLSEVTPFYLVGFVLILVFTPRRPPAEIS
jgi:F0F1-type ATP synthase membrane subunit c/vacuolar-type H+-ATPase subunit K